MTTGQTPEPGTPMEEAGGVSGMVNLTINLPDNIRISTVDSEEEETTVSNGNTTGMIQIFAGPTAPEGWLLCNGAAVSRATYSDLFDVIGTNYGVGNANTTFNLPDLRGRFPLGKDDMGQVSADRIADAEADVLGSGGGLEKYELTADELPPHAHELPMRGAGGGTEYLGTTDFRERNRPRAMSGLSGGGQAHYNVPPYLTVNYIIKT